MLLVLRWILRIVGYGFGGWLIFYQVMALHLDTSFYIEGLIIGILLLACTFWITEREFDNDHPQMQPERAWEFLDGLILFKWLFPSLKDALIVVFSLGCFVFFVGAIGVLFSQFVSWLGSAIWPGYTYGQILNYILGHHSEFMPTLEAKGLEIIVRKIWTVDASIGLFVSGIIWSFLGSKFIK